jgi:hypothetical protein
MQDQAPFLHIYRNVIQGKRENYIVTVASTALRRALPLRHTNLQLILSSS